MKEDETSEVADSLLGRLPKDLLDSLKSCIGPAAPGPTTDLARQRWMQWLRGVGLGRLVDRYDPAECIIHLLNSSELQGRKEGIEGYLVRVVKNIIDAKPDQNPRLLLRHELLLNSLLLAAEMPSPDDLSQTILDLYDRQKRLTVDDPLRFTHRTRSALLSALAENQDGPELAGIWRAIEASGTAGYDDVTYFEAHRELGQHGHSRMIQRIRNTAFSNGRPNPIRVQRFLETACRRAVYDRSEFRESVAQILQSLDLPESGKESLLLLIRAANKAKLPAWAVESMPCLCLFHRLCDSTKQLRAILWFPIAIAVPPKLAPGKVEQYYCQSRIVEVSWPYSDELHNWLELVASRIERARLSNDHKSESECSLFGRIHDQYRELENIKPGNGLSPQWLHSTREWLHNLRRENSEILSKSKASQNPLSEWEQLNRQYLSRLARSAKKRSNKEAIADS